MERDDLVESKVAVSPEHHSLNVSFLCCCVLRVLLSGPSQHYSLRCRM